MSKRTKSQERPRGIVHKRIFNALDHNENATAEEIAASVSGATPELVRRVRGEFYEELDRSNTNEIDELTALNPFAGTEDGESRDETIPETDTQSEPASESVEVHSNQTDDESKTQNSEPVSAKRTEDIQPTTDTETVRMTIDDTSESTGDSEQTATEPEVEDREKRDDRSVPPTPDDHGLSEKQLQTLQAIYEHPDASQRELANIMDIDHSTVAYRVSTIDDFDWESRQTFVQSFFENGSHESGSDEESTIGEGIDASPDEIDFEFREVEGELDRSMDIDSRIDELNEQLAKFNRQVALFNDQFEQAQDPPETVQKAVGNSLCPEVAHRIVQACLDHEEICEEEEQDIIESLFNL